MADGNGTQTRVRRRNDRVIMNLPVELISNGKKVRAVSQDLSPYGMFIRLSPPLPPGTVIQVVISPNGQGHVMTGQVTHALSEVAHKSNSFVTIKCIIPADFSTVRRLIYRSRNSRKHSKS